MEISKLSLEESIRNYDREVSRKESLESKASYFLGIISIFAGIWGNLIIFILDKYPISIFMVVFSVLSILTVIFILKGGFYALQVLKIRDYQYPFDTNNPNILKKQLSKSENSVIKELFDSYLVCFSDNNIKNNKKAKNLQKTGNYLLYSIITSVISIFVIWGIILL